MRIGVFITGNNEEHDQTLHAFATGLQCLGLDYFITSVNTYKECDVAVVFGVGKKNVPISYARGEIIRIHRAAGKDVVILEKGYVKRDEYYAVGLNGLNGRADFVNEDMPSDRWEKLGVGLSQWREDGEHIILCGQVPSDASVQNVDIIRWCSAMARDIMLITNMKILFRPHPLAVQQTPLLLGTKLSRNKLSYDLKNAWATVTYNSNSAVESIIAGVPAFAFDEGSMALPLACTSISELGRPALPGRQQWANNLAYTQWTLEEMSTGEPWLHIRRGLIPVKERKYKKGVFNGTN